MSCLGPILARYAEEITGRVAPHVRGPFGGLLRGYLPQHWVIEADSEVFTLQLDTSGRCSVQAGRVASPDVTLRVGHDRLRAALERRDPAQVPPGPFSATFHTSKGETAYRFLRSRLGL
jgi:hypothetical protein